MANIDDFTVFYACQDAHNNLVAVDQSSGGYPYVPTIPMFARFWPDADSAQKYAGCFKTSTYGGPYKVVKVSLVIEEA